MLSRLAIPLLALVAMPWGSRCGWRVAEVLRANETHAVVPVALSTSGIDMIGTGRGGVPAEALASAAAERGLRGRGGALATELRFLRPRRMGMYIDPPPPPAPPEPPRDELDYFDLVVAPSTMRRARREWPHGIAP